MCICVCVVQTTGAADGSVSCRQRQLPAGDVAEPHDESGQRFHDVSSTFCSFLSLHLILNICFVFVVSAQDSSIIDFYPDDFAIDLNGKKYAWQGESRSQSTSRCFLSIVVL